MAAKVSKVTRPEKFTLGERLYVPAVLHGMWMTLKHIFGERVTLQYPDEEHAVPAIYRGVHRLNKDEDGRVKCVACEMCAAACPAHCITIKAHEVDWPGRDKAPKTFEIDELTCISCGFCVEACPEDAIHMTSHYHMISRTRDELVFGLDKLLQIYDETKDQPTLRGVDFGDQNHLSKRSHGPQPAATEEVRQMAYPVVGVVTKEDDVR